MLKYSYAFSNIDTKIRKTALNYKMQSSIINKNVLNSIKLNIKIIIKHDQKKKNSTQWGFELINLIMRTYHGSRLNKVSL